jgi:hypothetical protein
MSTAILMTPARRARLRRIAADMFVSETRRGYIANNLSMAGDIKPDITEPEYIGRFVEQNKHRDLDELEEIADIVRPSSAPTAYEREEIKR